MSSTGSSDTMPNATAPVDSEHPEKVEGAGPDHGEVGRHRVGIDDGRHGVRGIVEPVDELESQRDEERNPEQHERVRPRIAHHGQIIREVITGIYDAGDDDDAGEDVEPGIRPVADERRGF